ncbi:anthranilate synthase component I family protein [Photobacterium sp. R1]
MKGLIEVISHTEKVISDNDSICIYNQLRKKYHEDELFLLESMTGPEKDCKNTIIAFEPIFNLKLNDNVLSLSGNEDILGLMRVSDKLSSFEFLDEYSIQIQTFNDLISLLRSIESLFHVVDEGVSTSTNFGFWGYFGYDTIFLIEDIERKISRDKNLSTINLTIFSGVINIDIKSHTIHLTRNQSNYFQSFDLSLVKNLIKTPFHYEFNHNFSSHSISSPTVDKEMYTTWFDKAKSHIDIGDIYQIQLGHEINITSEIMPFDVYLRLRQFNPSPYMYYFKTSDGFHVIGASPEMFVTLTDDREIVMRPIAGTIRNSSDPDEKKSNIHKLLSDEKENAEHLMLVDLCRNDISRICEPVSLFVDELMITEEYSHVIHIVSNVIGKISEQFDKYDALAATFPAGTMTGTPKIKATEIIEDTERTSRGIYAGCVGYLGFNDTILSALCIRTAVYRNGVYTIRASGGIVEDSLSHGEWSETISKLSSTYFAITNKDLISEDFVN